MPRKKEDTKLKEEKKKEAVAIGKTVKKPKKLTLPEVLGKEQEKKGEGKIPTKEEILKKKKEAKYKPPEEIKLKPAIYFAVGRRKTAVARIRLYAGLPKEENKIFINGKLIEEYFPGEVNKRAYIEPFRTTNTIGRFKITVRVLGSGKSGQLGACILGFARVIEQIDKAKFRPILKKRGLLTRDARTRERRKVGTGGKARRKKQSPKR